MSYGLKITQEETRHIAQPKSPGCLTAARLIEALSRFPFKKEQLLGEVLVRKWLFQAKLQQSLNEVFEKEISTEIKEIFQSNWMSLRESLPSEPTPLNSPSPILHYCEQRILDFLKCDGIFALYDESTDEAIPIPFNLHKSQHHRTFIDSNGDEIRDWAKCWHQLSISNRYSPVSILVPFGPFLPKGKSFLLPVAIANARLSYHYLPHPISYVSTGALEREKLLSVDAVAAKKRMASQMGASFIGPDHPNLTQTDYSFKEGESLADFLKQWLKEKELSTTDNLDSKDAIKVMNRIDERMKMRDIANDSVISVLQKCESVIHENGSDSDKRQIWKIQLLQGIASNHLGKNSEASTLLKNAVKSLSSYSSPSQEDFRARASLITALTGQGEFEEAEHFGAEAVSLVEDFETHELNDERYARMRVYGSFGGQTLLYQGLFDDEKRDLSLQHLKRALAEAQDSLEEIDSSNPTHFTKALNEVCQDEGQIAWWYALFQPSEFENQWKLCDDTFTQYFHVDLSNHRSHLAKNRILSAYRDRVLKGVSHLDRQFELPRVSTQSDQLWLLGLSYKYYGALLSSSGDVESARKHFCDAIEAFENMPSSGDLVDLLRLSVYVQYLQSIGQHFGDERSALLVKANKIATGLHEKGFFHKHPHSSPRHWMDALELIEAGKSNGFCCEAQKYFPY